MELQAGQNTGISSEVLSMEISADGIPGGMDLDVSAFMLADSGKVTSDAGMIFYGVPQSGDGAITLDPQARRFEIFLNKVPSGITKLAMVITIDKGLSRKQNFSQLRSVNVTIRTGGDTHTFSPDVQPMSETALILAELYLRGGQWKLRAVGQGFNGGLGPLAKHFGVDISDDPDTPSESPPVPPPQPRVSLSKITLEKAKPVSLEKSESKFGEIIVNLRWTKGGGFLSRGIDLDLGAMVELANGRKAVIQALGKSFGDLLGEPYVMLMGDDRTGSSGQGEFLHINGDHWREIRRVLIFAFIYDGVPSWSKADGSISIRMTGQPELEARLDSPSNKDMMCAVAMLENVNGSIQATKHVDYFTGHDTMDNYFGFGFRWRAGSK